MIPNDRTFNGRSYFQEGGKTFFRFQRIEEKGHYQFKIKFVSVNSPYKQGIAFKFSSKPEFKGEIIINGVRLEKPKKKRLNYVIEEALFKENEFVAELLLIEGFVVFCNASDILGDYPGLVDKVAELTGKPAEQFEGKGYTSGFSAANMYGNAFWVEVLSDNRYRFHCNDHKLDDDFDDLIFDVEVVRLDDWK